MTIDTNDLIDSILQSISRIDYIDIKNIPSIPLYMDQVTTFMDEQLKASKRYPDDKILTKTMINNYAKNNLLPPPEKKKYDKEHILVLIFIYYFKNILSIKDIEKLLTPLTSTYFKGHNKIDLSAIYSEVVNIETERIEFLKEDVRRSFELSQKSFEDASGKSQEFLQTFAFICALSIDVYVKKQIIEKLVDSLPDVDRKPKKTPAKKNDK